MGKDEKQNDGPRYLETTGEEEKKFILKTI